MTTTNENEPVASEAITSKEDKRVQEYIEEDEDDPLAGCGILGRYPIISVISFAVVGICIGVGLSAWDPDDSDTKDVVIKWLGLIGDLFIRSLSKLLNCCCRLARLASHTEEDLRFLNPTNIFLIFL
jgi:hypothetical protein